MDSLDGWAGWPPIHDHTITLGPSRPSPTSTALSHLPMPDPRQMLGVSCLHCLAHIHALPTLLCIYARSTYFRPGIDRRRDVTSAWRRFYNFTASTRRGNTRRGNLFPCPPVWPLPVCAVASPGWTGKRPDGSAEELSSFQFPGRAEEASTGSAHGCSGQVTRPDQSVYLDSGPWHGLWHSPETTRTSWSH